MKKFIIGIAIALTACVSEAPPPNWVRDDVFCWYKNHSGEWENHGLAGECPRGTRYGQPE